MTHTPSFWRSQNDGIRPAFVFAVASIFASLMASARTFAPTIEIGL
jgi:hypothetical protein